MRGDARSMRFLRPTSAADALAVHASHPDAVPIAGGTDVMVTWNAGRLNGRSIVDISAVSSWRRIRETRDGYSIGALATYTALQEHAGIRRTFPLLVLASATVGGVQIQNRGTIGGNVANASPAGDTFPPLAVYEASVRVASVRGRRVIPLLAFFAGVKRTTLMPGELITAIDVPRLPRRPTRVMFRKVGTRAAQAISKTVAAGALWLRRDGTVRELRFALGSMAPTVRRLHSVESYVEGRRLTARVVRDACAHLEDDVAPIDDLRSTRAYRMEVSRNLLARFLAG
jgi:CO/xanthine dehydrogenase FAD-binding subunit